MTDPLDTLPGFLQDLYSDLLEESERWKMKAATQTPDSGTRQYFAHAAVAAHRADAITNLARERDEARALIEKLGDSGCELESLNANYRAENARLQAEVERLKARHNPEVCVDVHMALFNVMRRLRFSTVCVLPGGALATQHAQACIGGCSGTGRTTDYALDDVMPALEAALRRVAEKAWQARHDGYELRRDDLINSALALGGRDADAE